MRYDKPARFAGLSARLGAESTDNVSGRGRSSTAAAAAWCKPLASLTIRFGLQTFVPFDKFERFPRIEPAARLRVVWASRLFCESDGRMLKIFLKFVTSIQRMESDVIKQP